MLKCENLNSKPLLIVGQQREKRRSDECTGSVAVYSTSTVLEAVSVLCSIYTSFLILYNNKMVVRL
jgi:hypothetical protein